MSVQAVPLRFTSPRTACLRELTGREERAVSSAGTADAIRLLDALFDGGAGRPEPGFSAAALVTADRDRLLAAVYQRAFGDRIESTLTCTRCGRPFDLHFYVSQLTASLDGRAGDVACRALGKARFETTDGLCFRLPTGDDELAVADLGEREAESMLLSRCAETSPWPGGPNAFQDVLDRLAPLLDLELDAPCAECGSRHAVQFDIQSYLLNAILGERPLLIRAIHLLASNYGWSLDSILSLTRSERSQLIELIKNDSPRRPALG